MLIHDLISKEFSPLSTTSTVEKALALIDGYKLSHVPVFEGLSFIGNIPEEQLYDRSLDETLDVLKPFMDVFFFSETGNIFDAVSAFSLHDTNVLPILNHAEEYQGVLLVEDVLSVLSKMPLLSEPSAMVMVKIPSKQYAMSEVAKIVESNNGRIFGAFISAFDNDMTEITIKFNAESLTSVVETFERFGYVVTHKFFNDDKQELLGDRYDQLMKFLDV